MKRKYNIFFILQKLRQICEKGRADTCVPFCGNMLLLGKCFSNLCLQRHIITNADQSINTIPHSGDVKLQIMCIHSPSHYSARLLEHLPLNSKKWCRINQDYLHFSMAFSNYYRNEANHLSHYPINVGDLCVIAEESTFRRCKIIEVK